MKSLLVVAACAMTIGLAGCSRTVPFVAPSPAAAFSATACAPALGALQDVAPPARHRERLLDPRLRPSSALICEYGSVFDQGAGPLHTLAKQVDLHGVPAGRLAIAAARIDVGVSAGMTSCGSDTGSVTVIVFGYRRAQPAGLWWHSTGCQTVDDGAVEAEQVANDSFGTFQEVFAAVTRSAG